jgi:hypothetical protein
MYNENDCDAIDLVLRQRPWCCTYAANFPMLILTSRKKSLVPVVTKIRLKYQWEDWSCFDKFCCLMVCFAAAIPFINSSPSGRKGNLTRKDDQQLLSEFIADMKKMLLEERGASIVDQDPGVKRTIEYNSQPDLNNIPDLSESEEKENKEFGQVSFAALNASLQSKESGENDQGSRASTVEGANGEGDRFSSPGAEGGENNLHGGIVFTPKQSKRKRESEVETEDDGNERSITPPIRRS